MISYLGLISQFFLKILYNYLFQAKNKTKCYSQDLAYDVYRQIYDVKTMSFTRSMLVILNQI